MKRANEDRETESGTKKTTSIGNLDPTQKPLLLDEMRRYTLHSPPGQNERDQADVAAVMARVMKAQGIPLPRGPPGRS